MELIYIARENKLEELKSTYSRRSLLLKVQIQNGPDEEKAAKKIEYNLLKGNYKAAVLKAKNQYKTKKVENSAIFNDKINEYKEQHKSLLATQSIQKKKLKEKYKADISSIDANDTKVKTNELMGKKETFVPVVNKEYTNVKNQKTTDDLIELNAKDKIRLNIAKKDVRLNFSNPFNFKNTSELRSAHKQNLLKIKQNLPDDKLKAKVVIFKENKRYREELISFKNSKTNDETIEEANKKLTRYEVKKIKSAISARKDAIKELKTSARNEKLVFEVEEFANKENKTIFKNNKKIENEIMLINNNDPKTLIKKRYSNDLLEIKKEANKSKNLITIAKNEKGIAIFGSTEKADPKARTRKSLLIGIIAVLLIMFLLPFLLLLNTSFKTAMDMFGGSALKLPNPATSVPYTKVMHIMSFWHSLWWSLLIVMASNVIIIVISSMAAWVLIRRKEWYSKLIFYTILTVMIVPFQAIMLPLMMNAGKMHMLNVYGLIFMYTGFGVGLSIFMMHGFLKSVPVALEEAAAIAGAGPIRTFIKVVFPIMKPIFITLFVLNTVWIWNDFLLPSLVLTDLKGPQTLPVKLYKGAVGTFGTQWNILMAGVTLLVIPTVVYFIFAQKYIISGVTQGAIK